MTERETFSEADKQQVSAFETFAPRVFPQVKPFFLLAEQTGALARLSPQRSDILVKYITEDLTMKKLGDILEISTQAVSKRIETSIKTLKKDMFINHSGRFKEVVLAYAAFLEVGKIKNSRVL